MAMAISLPTILFMETAIAKIRNGKRNTGFQPFVTHEKLLANWRSQMTPEERLSFQRESVMQAARQNLIDSEAAKELSIDHLFSEKSVARELHAAAMLLRRGIGKITVQEAQSFARSDGRFIRLDATGKLLTTREVLAEEEAMNKSARAGQGKYEEIGRGGQWAILNPAIARSKEQSAAIRHVLSSRDWVISITSRAGAGKTAILQEVVQAVRALSGKSVIVLAPSSSAVEVLKKEGFLDSDTFQRFVGDEMLKETSQGQILDEAGFLSARQMRWLLDFATQSDCRAIRQLSDPSIAHRRQ